MSGQDALNSNDLDLNECVGQDAELVADLRASYIGHAGRGVAGLVAVPSEESFFVVVVAVIIIEILVGCLSAHNSRFGYQHFGSLAAAEADRGNRA